MSLPPSGTLLYCGMIYSVHKKEECCLNKTNALSISHSFKHRYIYNKIFLVRFIPWIFKNSKTHKKKKTNVVACSYKIARLWERYYTCSITHIYLDRRILLTNGECSCIPYWCWNSCGSWTNAWAKYCYYNCCQKDLKTLQTL